MPDFPSLNTSSSSVIRWLESSCPATGAIYCGILHVYTQDTASYFLPENVHAGNCGVNGQETLRRKTFLWLHDGGYQQVFAHSLRMRNGKSEFVARARLTIFITVVTVAVRANGFSPYVFSFAKFLRKNSYFFLGFCLQVSVKFIIILAQFVLIYQEQYCRFLI